MTPEIHAVFLAQGHLIDSGLLSDALEAVQAAGASYAVRDLQIGASRSDESRIELEVTSPNLQVYERVRADLLSLGLSEEQDEDALLVPVEHPGVAPEGFYSTTNLPTEVRVGGRWISVEDQRMDSAIVAEEHRARCVKLRDLHRGHRVVVGHTGIRLTPVTSRKLQEDRFGFMTSGVSSERRLSSQVAEVAAVWKDTRAAGRRVLLVPGPVVVHVGAAHALAAIIRAGLVDGLLSGNALAVHDCEAAMFGTSLGVDLETGRSVVHGHMNHMRAINRVRAAGSLRAAVERGVLESGIMHACIASGVEFCLAGSIRDDGPLPDTEMDLLRAQARYARMLEGAGLVVVVGSMLHGIGVGNMISASVGLVCVDINPAVVQKLSDRGSCQSIGIVTDAGAFLSALAHRFGVLG
ncbi:MAG: hypothetical protein Fur0037_26770 [Planctomycetota bacterium]